MKPTVLVTIGDKRRTCHGVTFRLYKLIFLHRDYSDFIKLKTAYAVFLMRRALLNAAGVYGQNRIKCGCVKGWWGGPYQSHDGGQIGVL